MAKRTISVTLDGAQIDEAQALLQTSNISRVVDLALRRLIQTELDRRHVDGYLRVPESSADTAWAEVERDPSGVRDDTDWAGLYGVSR